MVPEGWFWATVTRFGYFGVHLTLCELILGLWKSILYKYQTSFGFESRFLAFGNHFRPLGVNIGICESILGLILDLYESTLGFLASIFCHFKFISGVWESILESRS